MSHPAEPYVKHLCLYIDGQFLGAEERETLPVRDPGTGEVIGELPLASRTDLNHALDAAERASRKWRSSSPLERARILRTVPLRRRWRAQLCRGRRTH